MDFISVIIMLSGLGKNKKVLNEACFTFQFKYLFQFSINFRFIINYMACVLVWKQLFVCFFSLAVFMSMLPGSSVCIFSSYPEY